MELSLGRFGDRRLEKGGRSCTLVWSRRAAAVRVRRLGASRAGEIRLTRFLRNPAVTVEEMAAEAAARTAGVLARDAGRRSARGSRPLAEKESRRWLDGAGRA